MGGNVDYTGGMVLQSLLREAVWVAVQPRTDDRIRVLNPGAAQFGWESCLEHRMDDLRDLENLRLLCGREKSLSWSSYVLGALFFLKNRYACDDACGLDLFIASDLPPNRGVSSSAALEVATLKAASAAWGTCLEGVQLATAGQWVENVVAGAACGIMDQAAIVLGTEGHLLPILCQPCRPSPPIKLPAGLQLWGIDSMVPRSTAGVAYETARAAAFMGYKLICQYEGIDLTQSEISGIPRWTDARWGGYLSNLAPSEFRSRYERRLPESLSGREFLERAGEHVDPFTKVDQDTDYPVRAAVRYATEENLRVQTMYKLLDAATWSGSDSSLGLIGEILCQSHVAYSECGLGSEACDELVSRALQKGFPGAKMTGGGAGGVVAILGRSGDRFAIRSVAEEYGAGHSTVPYIFEGSSSGVDAFGVRTLQLFPNAGNALSTRTVNRSHSV
jgi:L-arabinokinase